MIISRIVGGLGNQMFQYAAGLALARHHNVPFFLDTRGYAQDRLRTFTLSHFAISASLSDGDHLPTPEQIRSPLVRLIPWFHRPRGLRIYREYSLAFDPTLPTHGNNMYLDGYWQSEKYFSAIATEVRQEFSLREPLDSTNAELTKKMMVEESISLHVRRGDYVNHPLYATCSLAYYHAAIDRIRTTHPAATVYVFSDDPAWVKANITTDLPVTYVTHNQGSADYKDLVLMSACRHHIIANSSFSWWGAWLGQAAGKIVIAPNAWYTDPTKDTRDLLPTDWITLPV